MHRHAIVRLYIFSLLLLSGCFTSSIPLPQISDDSELLGENRISSLLQLQSSAQEIESFRSLIELDARKSVGREQLRQVVVFVRPDKLRVEFFEPNLTQLLMLIVIRDGLIQGVDKGERRGFFGTAGRDNIAKLLSVPLDTDAAMLWFVGRFVPPATDVATGLALYQTANGELILVVRGDDGRDTYVQYQTVGATKVVKRLLIVRHTDESVLLETKYQYQDELSRFVIPSRVEVALPEQDTTVVLTYSSPVANPANVRDQLFTPPSLDGLSVTDLDAIPQLKP